jgi:hypothetical protein
VDSSGNVFVTGSATIKYSNAGVLIWTNNTPFNFNTYNAIAVDSSGNVFVTSQSVEGDYVTVKYSNPGVPLWTNRYNGGFLDTARAMALDSNGNVFVTGSSGAANGFEDYATVKYSNAGVPLWTNRYDGPANRDDYATAIAVDSNGNVFVTGVSYNEIVSGDSAPSYATIKYSNAGVLLWANRYSGPANVYDRATAIAVDSNGNVFVTGISLNDTTFPRNASYATIAYSNAGEPLWENRYIGPENLLSEPNAIAVDRAGNVFVTGYSWRSDGYSDYVTIKYSSSLPPPVYLDFQTLNNALVLSWTNAGFNLQTAPAVTGPFTNISGATSPYTNATSGAQQFFRLKGD